MDRPEADLGAVEFEGVQSQDFRGNEAVWARWGAGQPFAKEVRDRLGPGAGMVAARSSGYPQSLFLSRAGEEVIGGERVEAAAGQAELFGGLGSGQDLLSEGGEHMADERRAVAMRELLVLFKSRGSTARLLPPSPFVGLRYAPASFRAGREEDHSTPT